MSSNNVSFNDKRFREDTKVQILSLRETYF